MSLHDDLAADVARRFHEAYERLAPTFGYETRPESAVPWEDVPEANRALMTAVVSEVEVDLVARLREAEARVQELERERGAYVQNAAENSRRAQAAEAALAESAKREGEWRRKFGRAAHELNEAESALDRIEARVQELERERDELQRRVEKDRYEFSREAEAAEAALADMRRALEEIAGYEGPRIGRIRWKEIQGIARRALAAADSGTAETITVTPDPNLRSYGPFADLGRDEYGGTFQGEAP